MQVGLLNYYITELLQGYLKTLADKFPMTPLGPILSNHLMFPEDSHNEHSRLHIAAAELYTQIKLLEKIPDEDAIEPYDPEKYQPGTRIDVA